MRKKIGEILIEAGALTAEQLHTALSMQKNKKKRLGHILVELGFVDDMRIAEILSEQLALPLVRQLTDIPIPREVLDAIKFEIAEKNKVIPLRIEKKRLVLAMADPLNWQLVNDISFITGMSISVVVASETDIDEALAKFYGSLEKIYDLLNDLSTDLVEILNSVTDEDKDSKIKDAAPIVKLTNLIIGDAVKSRASDIHLECSENHVKVRYRIDGELKNVLRYPKHIHSHMVSRLKILANLDITNKRLPQDGRITARVKEKSIDLRVSTIPTIHGENLVLRLLDESIGIIPVSRLGIGETAINTLIDILNQPQGMLIVTGPTGSGKTSTLYSLLRHLYSEELKIITIEDPVEYKIMSISQIAVNEQIGMGFSTALRSILRQDPDIIMVGEIRDNETAEIAARAALTGHLVLTTLHTNDSVSSITRLLDVGIPSFLLNSALTAIIAQRLVRKICPVCKTPDRSIDENILSVLPVRQAYRGIGCKECANTGYKGRTGVFELLTMNSQIKRAIASQASEEEIREIARTNRMTTLLEEATKMVNNGVTTVEEVISKIPMGNELWKKERNEKTGKSPSASSKEGLLHLAIPHSTS